VPKCSIVDDDAIAPRKLCFGDGSFSCPLFVQIHHAKRELKLSKKTRYLNSAAGFICGCTELESNAAECKDALFHEPLFQVFCWFP